MSTSHPRSKSTHVYQLYKHHVCMSTFLLGYVRTLLTCGLAASTPSGVYPGSPHVTLSTFRPRMRRTKGNIVSSWRTSAEERASNLRRIASQLTAEEGSTARHRVPILHDEPVNCQAIPIEDENAPTRKCA